jgi:hypothetical protein
MLKDFHDDGAVDDDGYDSDADADADTWMTVIIMMIVYMMKMI